MVFSRALTDKIPSSSLNELTRIISNDDGVFNYFIKMKDYIVKTTRSPNWENQSEAWASQAYKAFIAFQGASTFL